MNLAKRFAIDQMAGGVKDLAMLLSLLPCVAGFIRLSHSAG